jgi:integrase
VADPKPRIEGRFWYLRVWQNVPGVARKRERIKLAPASTPEREVLKMAAERLRSVNRGLITVGSGVNFMTYVEDTYIPTELPLLAKGVQGTYRGMINKHLKPAFENAMLRDITPLAVQQFFSAMPARGLSYPTMVKVRDALSSVLRSAVRYEFLEKNPLERLQLPPDKRGKLQKPVITPAEFQALLVLIPEPYASMVYVATYTGLRVSELAALKWKNILEDSITVAARYSKGDWSCTKTQASAAPVAVARHVVDRIQRLKTLMVEVRAGCAVRCHKVVKSAAPENLVFQSVWRGKEMNADNIRKRFIQPAAEKVETRRCELEVFAHILCDLATSGGSRPEIGAGTDAALAHLDHHGHLRAVRSGGPEESRCKAHGVRGRAGEEVWSIWSITGPIKRPILKTLFEIGPRKSLEGWWS